MTYSVRNIVIAIALAAVAAVLVILYTGNVQQQAQKSQQSVTVLVATQDIPAGMKVSDAISAGFFAPRQVVSKDQVAGALNSVTSLNRSLATAVPITAGSQITTGMFGQSFAGAIPDQVKGTDRGYQLALYPNAVLNGTLAAGDHVDIVFCGTVQPSGNNQKFGQTSVCSTLMTDVPVLSTPSSGAASTALAADATSGGGGSWDGTSGTPVILQIPQNQLTKLFFAQNFGHMWFAIRPRIGAKDTNLLAVDACSVVGDGLNLSQLRQILPWCTR